MSSHSNESTRVENRIIEDSKLIAEMSESGYKANMSDDRLRLRKRTFQLFVATHNDLGLRFDRFVLRKRKKLASLDFVA